MAGTLLDHLPVEILVGRGAVLSSLPIELLITPAIDLAQAPLEVALGLGAAISQAPGEILVGRAPDTALAQAPLEVLLSGEAQIGQIPIEIVLRAAPSLTPGRLAQLPIEILIPLNGARLSQAPVELLVLQARQGWRLTIDGVDRTGIVDAVTVTSLLNERARASIVLADYLPPKFADVVSYAKDGITKIFGGVVVTRHLAGRNAFDPTFTVALECGDYFTYADWVTTDFRYDAPVTLKRVLDDLVTGHLAAYGIRLDPAQVDGPTLAPFFWQGTRVSDAIRDLSSRTDYVARITATKLLRMFLPGTEAAPFTITEAAPHAQELTWTDSEQVVANKVTIIAGPNGQRDVVGERHAGDGVAMIFPLYAPYVTVIGALQVWSTGIFYPVGIYGEDDQAFTYDPVTNAIRLHAGVPPLALGDGFTISYGAQFPFSVTATTGAVPVIEFTQAHPDVLSIPAAEEIANNLLATLGTPAREVAIVTDEDGWVPGQALTIDLLAFRQIAGRFTITDVGLQIVQDTGPDDEYWQYTLKAIESASYQGSYLDEWRRLTVAPTTGTPTADGGSGRRRGPARHPR
jgi:hypothetical protein